MEINEFRIHREVKAVEPPKQVAATTIPVGIKIKPKAGAGFNEYPYEGYRICNSTVNKRWFIISNDGVFAGYALNYADAVQVIDYELAFKKMY